MEKETSQDQVSEAAVPYELAEQKKRGRPRQPKARKEEVITIRVTPEQKYLLTEAARARWMNVSQFVLSELLPQAEEIVAQMPKIIVSEEEYERLLKELDAPPKENEALRRFLAETPDLPA
jgi:uncharacterized protein (DUF1778 family)